MVKNELEVLKDKVDIIFQEVVNAIEISESTQMPIQNIISVLAATGEFCKFLNTFTETHSKDGSFII